MFTVWNNLGVARIYEPRMPSRSRRVVPVEAISSAPPVTEPDATPRKRNPYEKRGQSRGHKPVLVAKDIMNDVVEVVFDDAPVGEVLDLMKRRRFRHIPIVNNERALVGIISDRDILAHLADHGSRDACIHTLMHTDIIAGHADTDIRDVAKVLFEEHIGCLPVVTEKGQVVGILTRTDLLRAIISYGPFELWV